MKKTPTTAFRMQLDFLRRWVE